MITTTLIFASFIAFIIWGVILESIIRSASRSKKIELQLKMQTLLLAKMAQKLGVSDSEVNTIINI